MKVKKGAVIGIAVFVLVILVVFVSSLFQKDKARENLAKQIFGLGGGNQGTTVEELKASIAAYEKRMDRYMEDAVKTGTYWKILAVRLQNQGLHGEALEALEHAIGYSPADPALHYYTGVSSGIMAKSVHQFPGRDPGEREQYFTLTEDAYLRAIELDGRYLRPRYGLGVLYVFELNRPEDAVPHLEKCLEISRNDVDTMFVLARAFFMLQNYEGAVALYDRIITLSGDPQKKTDAQNNRQQIMGIIHG